MLTSFYARVLKAHPNVLEKHQHTAGKILCNFLYKGKGKVLLYLLPRVGPGVDPGVQAVSPQVALSHPPGGRLLLLSATPVVTFPAGQSHRPSASTKIYCSVTEADGCEQLAEDC